MWDYYKRTFLAVQLAAGGVSWMVYRSTSHQWMPTAVFFLSMQVSAVFGAMWANRLRRRMQARATCVIN
jgi:hypothetical protein